MAKNKHRKRKGEDRTSIKEALVLLRASTDFIIVASTPHPDREKVAQAIARGEPPPEDLRLFATDGFQPPKKTAATLGVMARSLYQREALAEGQVPDEQRGLPVDSPPIVTGENGKITLGNNDVHRVLFGTDGDYGETIQMLAIEEELFPDGSIGSSKPPVMFQYPESTDHAKINFEALETWAKARAEGLAAETGWPLLEIEQLIHDGLIQVRKAWEHEENDVE